MFNINHMIYSSAWA